jgi:hypothetical protein
MKVCLLIICKNDYELNKLSRMVDDNWPTFNVSIGSISDGDDEDAFIVELVPRDPNLGPVGMVKFASALPF